MTSNERNSAKLPAQQLAILAICRFAEPVVLTSVYPYLPEMIESFGIEKNQVAKWAGITSAAFSFSQSATAIFWGRASDYFGRKPVIITGLFCTMICSLIWGFSQNLTMAIMARAIQGAFNGNVGSIRTMVAEMVPEKELQPTAFSIMPLVWTLGSIFGPSFGGFFAKPAEHYPRLFGDNAFFIKFPFTLPNIVASFLFFIGISNAFLFLQETHHGIQHRVDYGLILGEKIISFFRTLFYHSPSSHSQVTLCCPAETSTLSTTATSSHKNDKSIVGHTKKTSLSQIFTRQSSLNLLCYSILAMHSVAYDQLLPIFMHTPTTPLTRPLSLLPIKFTGGFGLDSSRIGTIFTIYGIFGGFVQFLVFPPAARRFGVRNCFRGCSIIFPIIYLVTPYTALIQSSVRQQVVALIIMIFKCVAVIFSFPCSIIMLTNSADNINILGTLNGFAVTFSSIGRAIGPAVSGAVYSWGQRQGYGIAPWWVLGIFALVGALPIWLLVEGEGFAAAGTTTSEGSATHREDEEVPLLGDRPRSAC
ncbi:hypothetical protein K3495_g9343 [Podosphaera aphanis]|nr:hypothetical protein K3495_g9343 [Podosphaera aphanis]